MPYTLVKLLSGGAFTTGIGADWRAQFEAASVTSAQPTMTGEIAYPGAGTAFGVYAAYAFEAKNPFDSTLCVPEASGGSPVQVYMNGTLVAEVSTPGSVVCSACSGVNVFEAVRGVAPLVVLPSVPMVDPLEMTGRWVSLFPAGADPFSGTALSASGPAAPL